MKVKRGKVINDRLFRYMNMTDTLITIINRDGGFIVQMRRILSAKFFFGGALQKF